MAVITDEWAGRVALVTLRRPDSLNAITEEIIGGIEAALDRHETDDSVAIVITGEGRAFCAGSDLKQMPHDADARIRRMHALALRLVEYPKLSVAALNGLALGGGLELALACTLRVATPTAALGVPEVKLALMPGYGGTQLLVRTIGETRTLAMLLTGDPVSGEEAKAIGLVNALADDAVEAAIALAERCTAYGQPVQLAMRKVVREGARLDLREALALEHALSRPLAHSPEAHAAISAFARRGKN